MAGDGAENNELVGFHFHTSVPTAKPSIHFT
jgi:hypothetical protein